MDINIEALAGLSAAEAENYVKAQLAGETNPEPVQPKEEEPQTKPEAKTEEAKPEVVIPKDKLVQKVKILTSQARGRKETAAAKDKEIAELKAKIQS
jgi:hypothetical protein